MNFLNPLALLFLLAVPLLILLYFLKLKRPQVRTASTLLWQKVIEDMRVNSPFQKLKRSILLILQLLALIAAVIALSRPLLHVQESGNQSLIVLLDNSASMNTVEPDGRTRLERAKAEIARIAGGLARDDDMMLVTFNTRAAVACGFTSNKRQLKDVIAAIKPTECATLAEPAFAIAKSLVNSRAHPRVLLFSDGVFPAPQGLDLDVPVEYRKAGTPRPNLAITGLDVRRSINDRSKIEMFVAVENFSKELFSGNMTVQLDGAVLDSKHVSVGAQETLSQIFEAVLPAGGNVKVEFDAKDALAADNCAWKVVPPPLSRRILIVGPNSYFIERAFKAAAGVSFKTITPEEYDAKEAAQASTVIWNCAQKPRVAPCNNVYLGCFPTIEGLTPGAKVSSPDILDWDNSHPVNRFIDYDNLLISSAVAMTLPEHASVILRSSRTPLIGLFAAERGVICVAAFDPMQSNWPLLVSFPLFLNGCLDYFDEQQNRKIETNIPVGKTITVPPTAGAPAVKLPSGEKRGMNRNASGEHSFAGVDACGIYRVEFPAQQQQFSIAANLFDRRESTLEPAETIAVGRKTIKAVGLDKKVNREYWNYLVMAAGAVLLVEWIVYHRRLFV